MPKYKLIPEPVPPAGRRGASSTYCDMIDQFLEMNDASVRVEYDRKPATVYVSLKRTARSDAKYDGIKVSQRGENVYLIKE